MSVGRRFVDLIRSNLGSLFERGEGERTRPLEELSDDDLERELSRRRARRDAAERAASATGSSEEQAAWEEVERAVRDRQYRTSGRGGGYRRTGSTPGVAAPGARRAGGPDPKLAQLYAQLECPYGSDLNTVRKHYRALMLKYHPDMHSGRPEKQRLATELTQRLTMAYNELRRVLSSTP